MQEPCKRSAGLCRETARGLQEACGGPACRESSLPCRSHAGELRGHCQTTARGDLQGIRRKTARGLRACGSPASAGMCRGSTRGLQAIAANLQGIRRVCKDCARELQAACGEGNCRETAGELQAAKTWAGGVPLGGVNPPAHGAQRSGHGACEILVASSS